ncbi:glutamate racemase [Verrucomicrobiaceae bacterium N1E253]|uniref:Glutamate racemase n=1 Tax=Oceaniferula marina TaxID=2748318 RepID=A0A851GA24_9BACT|nr:glutamate racemase [Oceaniferula marina]NWK54588.1 glutamate racemase [Oceaniferula marina]
MNAPIGILDSGLGGLSVLNEIRTLMPGEDVIYFGDSAWCPYGPRHPEEIQRRVIAITDVLIEQNCKLVVIACNSATISAVEALRATYPIPFVGMEPAVKPAATLTRSGTVGVLATEASLAGEKFHRLVHDHADGVRVITRPCPNFVQLVEQGELSGPRAKAIVEEETIPLLESGADVLVLGCTHYPFLKPLIEEVAGPNIHILDTGSAVAHRVLQLLHNRSRPDEGNTRYELLTTGSESTLRSLVPTLCPGLEPERIAHYDLSQ